MEINEAILRGLSLKFHEDDTFVYQSARWPEPAGPRQPGAKLSLPLREDAPQYRPRRKPGCPKAYSAQAWLGGRDEDSHARLFANIRLAASSVSCDHQTKLQLARLPQALLRDLLGQQAARYFEDLLEVNPHRIVHDCQNMIFMIRKVIQGFHLLEQEDIFKSRVDHLGQYSTLKRLKYVLSGLYGLLVELRGCFGTLA